MDSEELLSTVADLSRAKVLGNPYLLELIFEHFGDADCLLSPYYQGPVTQSTRQCLLWASLTVKSFSIPALTILWRHMGSIWPLLLVLPNLQLENGIYKLIGSIDDRDLERFLFYASRIRVLHLEESQTDTYANISMTILKKICDEMHEPISSLQQLFVWFDQLEPKQLSLLPLISLSNVNTLHLKTFLPYTATTTSSFLQSPHYKYQLKSIRSLKITGDFSAFDPRLPNFPNLQHLHLANVSSIIPACFLKGCASSMPCLKSLKLHLFSEVEDSNSLSDHEPAIFGVLSTLDLGGFPKAISCFLEVLRVPLVCTLILCMLHGERSDLSTAISKFIQANRQTAKQTIRALTIAFEPRQPLDFDLNPEDFSVFERLESFYFSVSMSQIPVPQLSKFLGGGNHWLNIRDLSLLYGYLDHPEQTLTIDALPIVADRCPNLDILKISIHNPDTSGMLEERNPEIRRPPHNLSILELRDLPQAWDYTELLAVTLASFVHHIFPRLRVAECQGCLWPERMEDWWESVRENLTRCQSRTIGT